MIRQDWDTMFYNNLLSIPVLVVFSILFEDWSSASLDRNFPAETRSLLLFAMAFSGAAAVFISYTTAWCVRTTSSTTYSMVGALNKLPVAASGMLFFGDPVTLGSVSAVLIGFLAGVTYSVAKIAQSKAAPKGAFPLAARRRPVTDGEDQGLATVSSSSLDDLPPCARSMHRSLRVLGLANVSESLRPRRLKIGLS